MSDRFNVIKRKTALNYERYLISWGKSEIKEKAFKAFKTYTDENNEAILYEELLNYGYICKDFLVSTIQQLVLAQSHST